MNNNVNSNCLRLKTQVFIFPLVILVAIIAFLYSKNALNVDGYREIQKDCFLYINHHLGQFPILEYNLTQLGDEFVLLCFLSLLMVNIPRVFSVLTFATIASTILSVILKAIFAVPRPAATINPDSFIIVGKTLTGHSSLPSGHSITIFTNLTILMFVLMPKNSSPRALWFIFAGIVGYFVAFSRVGVGAHYPLDVIFGSIIGYVSGLIGIFVGRKYEMWKWVPKKKSYPFFIGILAIFCVILAFKIFHENLIIYYISMCSLLLSIYKITKEYVKK